MKGGKTYYMNWVLSRITVIIQIIVYAKQIIFYNAKSKCLTLMKRVYRYGENWGIRMPLW